MNTNNQEENNPKKYFSEELKNSYGLTTGSLATATSLVSLKRIIEKKNDNYNIVKILTPFDDINVEIESCKLINENKAESSAIKYPYNDPDVTVNLKIVSSVELISKSDLSDSSIYNTSDNSESSKVLVFGGKGVGRVIKPGLQISKGKSAINPIPLSMIEKNLEKYVPNDKIAKVTISVPDGEKIAKKTMNPRLGIMGGISILGTTGIARAMSTKAYKKSLTCQLDIAIAEGYKKDSFVFVPGNIGEKLALKNLVIEKDQIIQMGNFVGFMLEEAKKREINKITLFGHIGKLVKVAGGIFNTKHSIADGRKEIIAAHAGLIGANKEIIKLIFDSKTTEEMISILRENSIDVNVLNSISLSIKKNCLERFNIMVDVILVDMEGNQLNSK